MITAMQDKILHRIEGSREWRKRSLGGNPLAYERTYVAACPICGTEDRFHDATQGRELLAAERHDGHVDQIKIKRVQ